MGKDKPPPIRIVLWCQLCVPPISRLVHLDVVLWTNFKVLLLPLMTFACLEIFFPVFCTHSSLSFLMQENYNDLALLTHLFWLKHKTLSLCFIIRLLFHIIFLPHLWLKGAAETSEVTMFSRCQPILIFVLYFLSTSLFKILFLFIFLVDCCFIHISLLIIIWWGLLRHLLSTNCQKIIAV